MPGNPRFNAEHVNIGHTHRTPTRLNMYTIGRFHCAVMTLGSGLLLAANQSADNSCTGDPTQRWLDVLAGQFLDLNMVANCLTLRA